jgi:hypothetical protein
MISASGKFFIWPWITSSSPTRRSTVIAGRFQCSAQDSTGSCNE